MPVSIFLRKFFSVSLRFLTLAVLLASTVAAVSAAPVEKPVERVSAPRPLQTAVPMVTLGVPATAPVGSDVSFTVSFKNNDTQTGYGPFVDMVLDTTGPDGVYPGAAAADLYDGLGASLISASYLGVPFVLNSTMWVLEFDAAGHANHPLARDASGAPIVVSAPPGFVRGDKLVVFRLPFGSFVNSQPAAVIDVTVNMSPLADIGVDLNVAARGGFQYGLTALDNWCCDPVVNTISGWNNGAVKPSLFTLAKTYSGPEDEAAAGPNFRGFYPMQYTVSAQIAAGQAMTNVVLTDLIPANLQAVTLISSSPAGAACTPIPATPGGTLSCNWGATSVSGTASFTFDFYIPTGVVPPVSGDDVISCNNASATAFWATPDARDADQTIAEPNPDTGACEHTLTDKSIAVQKSVSVVGGGDPAPGKQLEYTLNFQVADDFAFQNIVVSDIISDGQHYDATFTPTLTVTEQGAASSGAFTLANVNVDTSQIGNDVNPLTNGTTTIYFNVSDELVTRALDAQLLGGCVPTGGTASVDCSAYNGGETFGTIVFRTLIQENFTDTYPSGDPSVDQGDILDDVGSITGDILSTVDLTPNGSSEADGTAASVSIGYGQIAKSVYAVTNSNTGVTTLNPASVQVGAGDLVTYKIEYSLPTSDFEGLTLTDYLPLPIFNAAEVATFTNAVCNDLGTGVPAAGKACLGTGDTYQSLPAAINPALSTDAAGNWVKWVYGNYDSSSNLPSKIELVFTVTVRDDPFADGLYLTNQANATETSTQSNSSNGDSIVQIQLTEPVLMVQKGIVASSNPAALYSPATPAPLAFTAPGSAGSRWSGVINSTALAATPIDSNISNVDAGDLVTFAIVIQNSGSGINGAFDITITDTLDALGFEFPTVGDPNSLNLRIAYGDSASAFSPISYTKPDNTAASPADLFGGGIKLVDPAGEGVCQAYDPNTGNNVIIISYDLRTKSGITPGTYINTASITNYSGTEGGPNFASGLTDTAEVTTAQPQLAKTLTSSEENYAGNTNSQAVIGELVNYTLTVTVPEGVINNAILTDTMASGLAFVQVNSVTLSAGVSTSKTIGTGVTPGNVTIGDTGGGTGNNLTFDFGNITNTDTDNTVAETIAIEIRAITLDVIGNQAGTVLANNASFVADGVPVINTAPVNLTVVEPDLTITKTGAKVLPAPPPATFDAGDTIEFTITITNPNPVNAYDVTLSDTFPALIDPATLTVFSVTDSASTLTTADFQFAANVLSTKPGSEFDMPAAGGRTVTVKVRGNIVSTVTVNATAQTLTNTARSAWTSINGTRQDASTYNLASDERTGVNGPGAGLDNYAKDVTSTALTMTAPARAKYMVATSESNTAEPVAPFQPTTTGTAVPLTIGEIVRYRLSVALPEGVLTNFRLQDYIPDGMTFLNDGTAKAAFVSTSGTIASSDFVVSGTFTVPGVTDSNCQLVGSAVTGNTPVIPAACPALADNNLSKTTAGDNDAYNTGSNLFIMLGTLTNTSDNDADSEYVIVEFNLLLDNNSGAPTSNDLDENLFNRFHIYVNDAQVGGYSNSVYNVVQEPVITNLLKTATPNTGDAGDTIAYQVTFTNINGASLTNVSTAYDVVLTDTLPAKMDTPSFGGVDGVDYIFTPAACGVYGANPTPFVGNALTLNFTSLNPGCQVTVNYTARLMTSVNPGESLVNAAHISYTSLPGAGTSSNPTGAVTPGASGAINGERDGQGINPPNDYFDDSTAPVTVTQISPVKSLISTTDPLTLADNLTIGEVARFRLAVQIAEGSSPAFVVTDALPAGMQFLDDGSAQFAFVSNGAGIASSTLTCANDSGAAADDISLPTASVDCALTASGGPFGDGVDPVFSLGDLTNSDTDLDNEYVVIEFNAVLLNVSLNQDNRAPMPINNFGVSINAAAPVVSNDVPLTVVEPNLTVAKDVASISAQIDAGGTVNYQVVLTNTGSAPAYDSNLTDTLPAVLSLTAGSASAAFTGGASGFTDNNPSGAGNLVDVTIGLIPVGDSVTITYSATILAAITPAQAVDNTATATWTSLSGADANERDGSGSINNYRSSDPAQFTSDTISVVKSILASSEAGTPEDDPRPLAIGEVLRYRLAVAIPEGTNPALTLTDQLALGVIEPIFDTTTQISTLNMSGFTSSAYGAALEAASSAPVSLHDGSAFVFPGLVNYNPATGLLTFTLGDILNNDSDAEVEYIYIDFNVVVLNSAGNTLGNVFANDFSASETSVGPIASNSVSATLVEPALTVAKSLDDATWVYGQTITYTLDVSASAAANTSTAYDLVLADTVPTGLTYVAASASTPAGCALDDSTAPLLSWTCASLAPGATLSFTFQAQVLAPPDGNAIATGDTVTNTANLTWTSLPGAGTTGNATGSNTPGGSGAADGERDGSGGVNDYSASDAISGGLDVYYALGNRVWFDTDNSATINGSESGAPGVAVWLYASDGTTRILEPDGVTPRATVTDANGYYLFDYLPAGDYIVALPATNFAASAPLEGYLSSLTVRNADGSVTETLAPGPNNDQDSDVDENGFTGTDVRAGLVTLGADAEPTSEGDTSGTQGDQPDNRANMTVDFGFYKTEIGDLVYEDVNANGTFDAGDTPLDGVTVELLSSDGTVITSTTTAGGGLYVFTDLATGDYRVRVTTPADMLSTIDSADSADSTDPDTHTENNDNGIGLGAASLPTVTSGLLTMSGADFGASGAGYALGVTADTSLDFGFVYAYALGNRVWFDTDNSHTINGSEVGVDGVLVELYRASDLATSIASDTTSGGGYYLFDNLNPDDYVVVLPASNFSGAGVLTGYLSSQAYRNPAAPYDVLETAAPSPENDLDSDDNGTRQLAGDVIAQAVTLGNSSEPKGESDLQGGVGQGTHPDNRANMTVDFGFYKVSVGNLVWADADKDGAFTAGEPVFSGAAVTLYAADGATVLATTTTDASGLYRFDGLPDGDYILSVVAPTGTVSTRDDYAGAPGDNADANQNYDDNDNGIGLTGGETFSSLFTLAAGDAGLQGKNLVDDGTGTLVDLGATHNPTLDFGFTPVYSLGNRVWFDTNNDRLMDLLNEVGVDGVTVELYAAANLTAPLATQITANGGYYLFNNLEAGDYVVVIPAENFDNTGAGDTTTALVGYWSSETRYNATSGALEETLAHSPETSEDLDDNGTRDTSGGAFNNAVVAQTVTLGPTFNEPSAESDTDGTLSGNQQGQPDNQANMTVDFGFYTMTLGNRVWMDADNDGLDTAETGIDGVTVELYVVDGAGLPVGAPVATVSTAGGGNYTFSGLPQGNYLVRLPEGNFLTTGALRDYYSSTGGGAYEPAPNPDFDTTDADDNGSQVGALGFTGGYIQSGIFTLSPAAEASSDNATGSTAEPRVDFGVFKSVLADLSIVKDDGVAQYTPGSSVTYTITAANAGPSDVTGATVSDSFPVGVTASWTCAGAGGGTCTASGSGDISDTVNLPVGGSVTYTVTASIASSFSGDLTNTATVTAPAGVTETDNTNNSATDTDTPDSQADLSIVKDDGTLTYIPGGSVTYTITAANAGPSDVTGATVSDTFPVGVTATWTCAGAGGGTCTASGSGDISDTVNLPVGGSVTYTVTASIASSFSGALDNTATVSVPAGVTETDTTNNSDSDSDTQDSQADLSIVKDDGTLTYVPGGSVTYTITAANAGPSDVTGATVSDTFPVGVTASWTCAGAGGGTCTASGSGDISDTVNLPVGGSVTYTVTASIASSFSGALDNTATVSAPAGVTETDTTNNSDSDSDTQDAQADLSIVKDDGTLTYVPGGALTYTITVTNAGPSDAPASQVADSLPAQLASWAWVCSGASGGASGCDGAASNAANFSDTVDLPAVSSITYTVTAQIASSASGDLTNTVTVTAPAGVTDPTPGDNTASDTDTESPEADLNLTKDDGKTYYLPGSTFDYTIIINNAGPSDAMGATVSDLKPAQITSWDWACVTTLGATCAPQTGLTGDFADTVNLPAGSSITYTVTVTIDPAATGDLVNTATVSHPADATPGDNTMTDTDNPASLLVTKDDGVTIVAPGALLTYTITVENVGAVDLTSLTVTDTLPADVSFQSATPTPASVPPTGTMGGTLTWNGLTLAAGATMTLQVTVQVAEAPVATSIINSVEVADDSTGVTGGATDTDTISVGNAKSIIATSQGDSLGTQVFIGEILTYQISLDIPFGVMTNLTALDVVDSGLAFVRCVSVDPGALSTDLLGGFAAACADPVNPTVQAEPIGDPQTINQGRRALFNFGNVTNPGATDETLTVTYEVVVLDDAANVSGTTGLNNSVSWAWDGGSLVAVAPPVEVIEPELSIDKNASPNVLPYGSAVTFTIDIAHTAQSTANAYDVVVTDALPDGLAYIAGTIAFTGLTPTTYAYDSTSHTLTFNWAVFPLGQTSQITFQASFVGPSPVTNATNVVWTSLPLDPGQQSDYNTESTERWYDPVDSTGLNDYGARDSIVITAPVLPATGFAPNLVTALPAQPAEKNYQSLDGMWLEIPALNLTMPVTGVPLSSEGWDLTWLSSQAGYLQGTTYPGQVGTTGITGHVTLADGTPGPFRNLGKLFWGNQVILHAEGYRYVYEVREQRSVLPRDLSVFKQDGYTWMTLLTCDGYVPWLDTYNYRLAVRAVLLRVEVDNTPSPYDGRTQPLMDGR